MWFVFKNTEIGGEKHRLGLRAADPMFVTVFGQIGRIPLEPCDLGPIHHLLELMHMTDTYICQIQRLNFTTAGDADPQVDTPPWIWKFAHA